MINKFDLIGIYRILYLTAEECTFFSNTDQLPKLTMCCAVLSRVQLFTTAWTVACQAPLSMGILQTRILDWVAMPSSGDPANPGIEPKSPALWVDSLPAELPGKPNLKIKQGVKTFFKQRFFFYSKSCSRLKSEQDKL